MDGNKRLNKSAIELQQEYYEAIGDADWELYEKKDRKYLLQKVAVALCGPPSKEGNLIDAVENVGDKLKLQGYEPRDEETCMNVFNKIMEQAKYSHNGENLIISVLRVVCVIPSRNIPIYKVTPSDYWTDLHVKSGESVHILVFHVFSIRKCISMRSEVKGCRIFIDHDARVYESWTAYLQNNKLPQCVMIVPRNGEYTGTIKKATVQCRISEHIRAVKNNDTNKSAIAEHLLESGPNHWIELHNPQGHEMPNVNLTVQGSPELGTGAKVLNATDKISTAANVGALVTVVGSVFVAPAAAPLMVTTAVGVGVVTGVYGIARSITNLVDRAKHEQSINLKNSESRSSWLNIMVSSVGLSFTTAAKLLSWAAASGRNVKMLMSALDFLKYTNLATGFMGVANGLGDMIFKYAKYGEKPSTTELFQFTTSALLLGIGIMSNQTAQEIVQDAQAKKINEIRDSLSSNNKRKIFDKVTAETRRVQGTIEGNTDVIKALKTINNKDEFFGKLKNINKSVNKNKVRISLAPDGHVLVNNQHKVNLSEVHGIGAAGRNKLFAKYGPAKVTTKNAPTRIYPSTVASSSTVSIKELACSIRPEEIMKITAFIINLSRADQDFIIELLSHMSEQLHDGFLLLCAELIASLVPEIAFLDIIFPDWKRRALLFVFDYIKSRIGENDDDNEFVSVLKSYIRDGKIHTENLLKLKDKLMEFFLRLKKNKDTGYKLDEDDYLRKYLNSYKTLRVGQKLMVGPHTVLIKQITIDKIQMWLQGYSQEHSDKFMELCLKIVAALPKDDVIRLNYLNPDEDVIIRVSFFLLMKFETEWSLRKFTNDASTVVSAKLELMDWFYRQRVRKHNKCEKCKGITYYS